MSETTRDTIVFLTAARAHIEGQPWPPAFGADPLSCVGITEALDAWKPGSTNAMDQWDALIAALPESRKFATRYQLQQLDAFEHDPATTRADVLALFDRAIANLRATLKPDQASLFDAVTL